MKHKIKKKNINCWPKETQRRKALKKIWKNFG